MDRLKALIEQNKYSNIVVLTGAGISAESGIKTFRDSNGLWEDHAIEDVASPEGFYRDPVMVHRFYNLRRMQLREVQPNKAHKALAQLEKNIKNFTLITQNVDDLHERGGSQNIIHMHGELKKIKNIQTGKIEYFDGEVSPDMFTLVRPDIVWFGEAIKYTFEIQKAFEKCDLFLCIGTSNNVYPAAGFVQAAKERNALCIELNLEATGLSHEYDYNIYGKATDVVTEFANYFI
jgi:NAD-dependent deacetylase